MSVTGAAPLQTHTSFYRWRICALLFFATTIKYVDRQVLGVLGLAALSIGWGTRAGYALSIAVWSVVAMSHALVGSVAGFALTRFVLGLGEAGNFPAGIKTVAEWFPPKDRALAAGLFNSGSNVDAIVAPLTVPWIAAWWGWQWAFLMTGLFSAVWVITWLKLYRPRALAAEPSDAPRLRWLALLPYRQTWAFLAAKSLTDPVWWFLLFWLPKFFYGDHKLALTELGPPLVIVFLMADAGSVAGGWLAAIFLKRGWSLNRARKTALLVCALAVTPIALAAVVRSLWTAVALVGLTAAVYQGWSANVYTLVSDMFPGAQWLRWSVLVDLEAR